MIIGRLLVKHHDGRGYLRMKQGGGMFAAIRSKNNEVIRLSVITNGKPNVGAGIMQNSMITNGEKIPPFKYRSCRYYQICYITIFQV